MALAPPTHQAVTLRSLAGGRRPTVTSAPSAPSEPVRIVVCHPAPLAGQAIAAILRRASGVAQVTVVATATELMREVSRRSDVALVSENLGQELPEVLQALTFRGLALPVLVMATDSDAGVAAQYLEWGAAGSVDVRRSVAALVEAVQVAATGAPVVDRRHSRAIVENLDDRADRRRRAQQTLHALSAREREVLSSLAGGTGVTDIARNLHLSPHTIRACIRTLGPKLHVAGQLQIAAVARELIRDAEKPATSRYLHLVRAAGELAVPLSG